MDMNNSAVNLGRAGFDTINYMQDGGSPAFNLDDMLSRVGPGAISPTPQYTRLTPFDEEYGVNPPEGGFDQFEDPPSTRGYSSANLVPDIPEYTDETGSQRSFLNSISGPGRALFDGVFGGGVNTKGVTKSARPGSDRYDEFYVEGQPDFQSQLIEDFDYPSVTDPETGDMIIPTDKDMYSEKERTARARIDMPAYQELEDARGHMLGSALLAQEYGTNTAAAMGGIGEFMDYTIGGSTKGDVAMDTRNNAIGRQIFQKAGIDATAQEITRLVDGAIFKQLNEILGRTEDEQGAVAEDQPRAPANFKSPSKGPDLYYPRDEEGFYDTKRDGYEGYE